MVGLYEKMRQCYRKKNFFHPDTARKRARQIQESGGPQLYPYGCSQCGMWHLTKNKHAEGKVI